MAMTGSLTPQPRDRIRELDGLRGIACSLVLVWHLVNRQILPQRGPWGWIATCSSQCWSGVDLFFVLSGYLIIRNLARDRGTAGWLRRFVAARVFRLLPAYLILVAGCALLTAWVAHASGATASQRYLVEDSHPWGVYLLYFQNWYPILVHVRHPLGSEFMSVTWSLGAEVEFYFGSVVLFLFCPERLRMKALLGAAVAAVLIRGYIYMTYPYPGISALILPPARMDGFALGGFAALWLEKPASRENAMRHLSAIKACWAILLSCVLFLTFSESPFVGKESALFSYSCFALFYSVSLVVIVLLAGSPFLTWMRRGPLAVIGIISYGVYLFHKPIHFLFADAMKISDTYLTYSGGPWYLILELSLTLVFSAAIWKCIERPLMAVGRRVGSPVIPADDAAPGN
jgi:peptidoglycan/LPS O-acetylase OafA/YrhL